MASDLLDREGRPCASREGRYRSRSMVSRTRCRVGAEILASARFMTSETVVGLTFDSRATSLMLGLALDIMWFAPEYRDGDRGIFIRRFCRPIHVGRW